MKEIMYRSCRQKSQTLLLANTLFPFYCYIGESALNQNGSSHTKCILLEENKCVQCTVLTSKTHIKRSIKE